VSKNLIYQYYITRDEQDLLLEYGPDYHHQLNAAKIGRFKMKQYADLIGADYLFSSEEWKFAEKGSMKWGLDIFFERLRIIYDESFDEYDHVLFADCDVVPITRDNIFDECIGDVCGVFEREFAPYTSGWEVNEEVYKTIQKKFAQHGVNIPYKDGHIPIFNCGMYVMSREGRLKCRKLLDDYKEWYDESLKNVQWVLCDEFWLSCMLMKYPEISFQNLDRRWNGRSYTFAHEEILLNKFIHYHFQPEKHRLVAHWKHDYNEELDIPVSS
jgi:hypothetical protein